MNSEVSKAGVASSQNLAVLLARALFCGVVDRGGRVEVFIAGADETDIERFVYGGYAASMDAWDAFAEQWSARVLATTPPLEYLHVADLYVEEWRKKHNMGREEMAAKLDAAAEVIFEAPALIPATFSVNLSEFDKLIKRQVPLYQDRKQPMEKDLVPDFVFFVHYALRQMTLIHERCPSVTRVDFWVEQKAKISAHLGEFKKMLPELVRKIGHPELEPLIGDYIPVPKTRIQAQAADYLVWHQRHAECKTTGPDEKRRYKRICERHPSDARFGERIWRFGFAQKIDERLIEMAMALGALEGIDYDSIEYES